MVWRLVVAGALAGCGRLEFDRTSGAGGDGGGGAAGDGSAGDGRTLDGAITDSATGASDAAPDAPPNAVTAVFGECTAATVTGVTADTSIDSNPSYENHNLGGRDEMRVGNIQRKVSLLRFELSSLSALAQVVSASIEVTTSPTDALENGDVELFSLLEAWTEGTGNFQPNATANWHQRMTGVAWTTPGAGFPGSRSGIVLARFTPRVENTRYMIALPAATIQGWIATPATNFGVVMVATTTMDQGGWLSTSEQSDPARRPCLHLTYVP